MTQPAKGLSPLSVLVPAKNEEANLAACLQTVSFANDLVVVDSASTDATRAIAEAFGARVVQFSWDGRFPRKKNWALENVRWRNEWVLILDADERITPELQREISAGLARTDIDGFYLNRRFWFLGGWINHCGYFPSWNLRLFRHRKGRYERLETGGGIDSGDNEVHEHVLLDGKAEYLEPPMEHYAFPDLATFVEKHNRYSNWEAVVRNEMGETSRRGALAGRLFGSPIERRRWLKRASLNAPFRPSLRFLYHYVWGQGFRDGYRGWVLCRLLAWYELLSVSKAFERRMKSSEPASSPDA